VLIDVDCAFPSWLACDPIPCVRRATGAPWSKSPISAAYGRSWPMPPAPTLARSYARGPSGQCRRRECRVAGGRCRPVFSGWFDPTSTTSCTGGGNRGTVEIAVLRHCGEVLNRLYMTAINLRCRSMHRLSSSLGCPGYRAGRRCRNRAFNCEITRHWLDDSVDYRCAHVTRPREAVELFYRAPL
jgi:hypothetical protein